MKRIVRLTESDLARIVKRVMNESVTSAAQGGIYIYPSTYLKDLYGPGETVNVNGNLNVYGGAPNKITAATVEVTPEGAKLGLTAANVKVKAPYTYAYVIPEVPAVRGTAGNPPKPKVPARMSSGNSPLVKVQSTQFKKEDGAAPMGASTFWSYTFTAPKKRFINTGAPIPLFKVTFETNDSRKPVQTATIFMGTNAQFGTADVAPAASTN
jgi:hypothetical protein